jgi:hypothetical protein
MTANDFRLKKVFVCFPALQFLNASGVADPKDRISLVKNHARRVKERLLQIKLPLFEPELSGHAIARQTAEMVRAIRPIIGEG